MIPVRKIGPLVLVLVFLVAGCDGPHTVDVGYSAGTAQVKTGDRLRVDFGTINTSIGDEWFLVTGPDAAVLSDEGQDSTSDCLPGAAGCDSHLRWVFTAKAAGSTTVVFQYCYRSRPDQCQPQPGRGPSDPVRLAVTVSG
jgi:hypothetical protein